MSKSENENHDDNGSSNKVQTTEETSASNGVNHDNSYDYIFGFGSIMNTSTHAPWLQNPDTKTSGTESSILPGAAVTLTKDFGYKRLWNFRSSTGFTALGVSKAKSSHEATEINGVLFRVTHEMMPGFDRREVGYEKVRIPIKYVCAHDKKAPEWFKQLGPNDRLWLYAPLASYCKPADEHNPLLQSYVDTVLQGCLEWGGEEMADKFIQTTGGWSTYFLNDTPSSRRPWLFRKDYTMIDHLLQKYATKTYFGDRKHPEEFSKAFHRQMKGSWSIPRRNKDFTGRERELQDLRARFAASGGYDSCGETLDSSMQQTVVKVEVAGMAGVGKTQLCTEYCYRMFPSEYGLVVWLKAESSESLVADYRQLLMDLAQEDAREVTTLRSNDNNNPASASGPSSGLPHSDSGHNTAAQDTDEIVREVKTRLFRSQVPWLLVFDNLEDYDLLEKFVPRGAGTRGHILVTTRQGNSSGALILGCFTPPESIALLQRAAGKHNMEGEKNRNAAEEICERLGHLPLALGMAAAYMLRCDVNCSDYLDRYNLSESTGQSLLRHGKLLDYSLSVVSSLSLSLVAIEKESKVAYHILHILCFLGPDLITKPLLRHLLQKSSQQQSDACHSVWCTNGNTKRNCIALGILACIPIIAWTVGGPKQQVFRKVPSMKSTSALALGTASLFSAIYAALNQLENQNAFKLELSEGSNRSKAFTFSPIEYEQADLVWDILKSYSILTVKEGKGSIHRLLSQALRHSQSVSEQSVHLRICLGTLQSLWAFKAEDADTWKDSLQVLPHVTTVVYHAKSRACSLSCKDILKVGRLSTEAGVFSAMSLNAFIDAQHSFELAISLFESTTTACKHPIFQKARAQALHELGRVFRYQGKYVESQRSLEESLRIYERYSSWELTSKQRVADTLHELGVLEVKKHSLDTATDFLQQSLALRRSMGNQDLSDAKSAATLHQLAAIMVARKPPSLEEAKSLLQEALCLSRQIAQRAATLKQLARVTIRQGDLDRADNYLEQALDLYKELYGENKIHINIAAVKFQQGALALQTEQWDSAWTHFSECLRIRRNVYAYARPLGGDKDKDPTHLEVSCVLHELARVAFAQEYFQKAMDILRSERESLEKLEETSDHHVERIYQARLTNLTWMKKCAKGLCKDDLANKFAHERSLLKKNLANSKKQENAEKLTGVSGYLTEAAMHCRLAARKIALEKDKTGSKTEDLNFFLAELSREIDFTDSGPMRAQALKFRNEVAKWKDQPALERRQPLLKACDELRDVLRANGYQISDTICSGKFRLSSNKDC